MALVLKDRVKETTATTGTGTYTLAGAVTGSETFGSVGNSNTTYYCCTDGSDFEIGVGTYTSSGTTLARTSILQSSNSDNAVSWGAGTKTIFCTLPAEKMKFLDASNVLDVGSTAITTTGVVTAGGITLGNAVLVEAELEMLDGITAGTVAASKAVVVDADKDISGGRNLTISGELDAATLDISGDADIDGTLEADAITINGTAISSVLSPVAGSSSIVTTGALNSGSITSGFGAIDNGSSNITTTGVGSFASLDISGNIDVDGTANLDVVDIDGAVDMASTLAVTGNLTLGAHLIMPDVTSTKILVADGTSFQEVAVSGDVTIANTGAVTIAANAVEGTMLNNNTISAQTALTSGLATDDELLVSDAGTLKRMDVSVLTALTDDNATALAIALG